MWTRIFSSSVRGEPEEVARRGTFVGITVDAIGLVAAVEEGMCDLALDGSGVEFRAAGTREAVEVAVIEFSMFVLLEAGPRGTRVGVSDPEPFCEADGAATGMMSGGGSSTLTLLGVDCCGIADSKTLSTGTLLGPSAVFATLLILLMG